MFLAWAPHILFCGPCILWSLQGSSLLFCLDLCSYSFRVREFNMAAPGVTVALAALYPKPQIHLFLLGNLFSALALFTELCEGAQCCRDSTNEG